MWPLSRKSYPKQFSKIVGNNSLFEESIRRIKTSEKIQFEDPIAITNNSFRFIVAEQLNNMGVQAGSILIEPEAKNTAPAILAACLQAVTNNPDSIVLILPSDHLIDDVNEFQMSIQKALAAVENDYIVTFGVRPSRPETGFGYLELGDKMIGDAIELTSFIEKPDINEAEAMSNSKKYLWNAGMFMAKAGKLIEAFEKLLPDELELVRSSINQAKFDYGFLRLDQSSWSLCKEISIDYAVMEHYKNLMTVPLTCNWTYLGGWDAVWQEMNQNENGVALSDNATELSCKNTLLRSENSTQCIVGLGLEDIIAISMPDAVLVAHKSHAQNVRDVVTKLKSQGKEQAETFPIDYRPWGWFESLVNQSRFQVKRITVKPGAALSLQSHHHRSEHWIVVEGTAKVTIDEVTKLVAEGQSVYIPLGAVHRMENPGKLPMVLIEVQTGGYLGEDDITRYQDTYNRA